MQTNELQKLDHLFAQTKVLSKNKTSDVCETYMPPPPPLDIHIGCTGLSYGQYWTVYVEMKLTF